MMRTDLTTGPVASSLVIFALPIIAGNLLQQVYTITDTLIVAKFLGPQALAAVGSAYTLMTFITSILIGLCMGSGTAFAISYGERNMPKLHEYMGAAFVITLITTAVLTAAAFLLLDQTLTLLRVPPDIVPLMKTYTAIMYSGIPATFLYNYFAALLRSAGNSLTPVLFLAASAVANIILDLWFILQLKLGVGGAAAATVISQYLSALLLFWHIYAKQPEFRLKPQAFRLKKQSLTQIIHFSFLTSLQQSVMNLGILMVQGLVNSFGTTIMAAFAAAVKIDSIAYMPVQDFGNAFSTFIAQNYGAARRERIRLGIKRAVQLAVSFSLCVSAAVCICAPKLIQLFVSPEETEIIAAGAQYLRTEGAFYTGIAILFLFYGLYRALEKPFMSVVLTIISLGTRVALAYLLAAQESIGVHGIWWSIPIGWALADITGYVYYRLRRTSLLPGT